MAQQQNPYLDAMNRQALLGQMGGAPETPDGAYVEAPGLQPGPATPTIQIEGGQRDQPPTPKYANSRDAFFGIVGSDPYGAATLDKHAAALEAEGFQLQRDSQGRVRGRIKDKDGYLIDVPGAGEGDDWWNNQTGKGWGWTERGHESQTDGGGWSFGGGGSAVPMQSGVMTGMAASEDNGQAGGFFDRLMAQLRAQTGSTGANREQMLQMLGMQA